jgi:hypothetical protein
MKSIVNQMLGFDYTHVKMTGVLLQNGASVVPAVTILQGSHNGGGVNPPDLKVLAFDQATGQLVDYGAYTVSGASYDRHLYSNYLGVNPGVQGRNFAGAAFLPNPFVGQKGNSAKFLVLHALTGKDPLDAAKPELKPSSYVSITQLDLTGASTQSIEAGLNASGGGNNASSVALTEVSDAR